MTQTNKSISKTVGTLQFETSTNCNANCRFCNHRHMSRKGHMSLPNIIDLTFNLAHKAQTVCPFWMQEPTLDKRLADILSNIKCYAPRTQTVVYSNMGYYPKENWKTILETGTLDQLVISFFGTDKETYNTLQPPLDFETTKKNIKKLWRLRQKLGWVKPEINIRLLITPETVNKVKQYFKTWRPYADKVAVTFWESWDGNGDPKEILELNRKFFGEPAQRVPCPRLYSTQVITCDGDVAMCCQDYNVSEKLGNVFVDGYDLWTDNIHLQRLKSLHEAGEWGKIPICKDCTVYAYNTDKRWVKYWIDKTQFVDCVIRK